MTLIDIKILAISNYIKNLTYIYFFQTIYYNNKFVKNLILKMLFVSFHLNDKI